MYNLKMLFVCAVIVLLVPALVRGADPVHFVVQYTGTGNNSNIQVPQTLIIGGQPAANGDEVGVFTPSGLLAGAGVYEGSNLLITANGDNDQTSRIIEGFRPGERYKFKLWRKSSGLQYDSVTVTYESRSSETYSANSMVVITAMASVNRPPVLSFTDTTISKQVGTALSFQVRATDADNDSITFSFTGALPQGVTTSATGLISGIPSVTGPFPLQVIASDRKGGLDTGTVRITVTSVVVNRAPSITSTAITTGTVGVAYSYDVNASDPDGDNLAYSLVTKPSGMSIDSVLGVISWTPSAVGNYAVTVQVSDGKGGTNPQSFTIVVSSAQVTEGTQKWSYTTGNRVTSSPAIGTDGTIYVGSQDSNLYAFNPTGTLKWSYTTGGLVHSSPAIGSDGTIYIGSYDKKLYAVTSTGTVKWSYLTGGGIYSSPAIGTDGTIYVGSDDNKLYAVTSTGTLKWSYTTGDKIYSSPAIGSDGTIYMGSNDNKLYAITPAGTLKWSYTTGNWIYSSPAIGPDGTIYVGSRDNNLYALTPTGTLKWSYSTGGSVDTSPAVGSDGTIYVGSWNNNLYAITPTGTVKWSYPTGDMVQSSPAIGSDGTIYIGSYDRKLYAVTPAGSLKWSYTTPSYITSSPAIGSDGTIYVGSWINKLYAVTSSSTGGLASSSWAMFHHDNQHTGAWTGNSGGGSTNHFSVAYLNTGINSTVMIPTTVTISIDGQNFSLASDDEIAIYTPLPDTMCCGLGKWTGSNLSITVWGDNDQTATIKEGFISGQQYRFHLWDASASKEYRNFSSAIFLSGNATYSANGISVLSGLNFSTIDSLLINLSSGWNMISSNVKVTDSSMSSLFNSIVSNVVIVKNNGGQVYWPDYGVNQIGSWRIIDGYMVYMRNAATLRMSGTRINPTSTSMTLQSGWSMIAYLPNVSLAPSTALTSLGDKIVIIKDGSGKVYWPQYGVNQIGTMQVGKGYQIYLSSSGTLTYPASASKESNNLIVESGNHGQLSPQHFAFVRETGTNSTILVKLNDKPVINGTALEVGDEIGVFSPEGICAGAGVWNGENIIITVWGDNGETMNLDGFTDGQAYTFKLWDKSTTIEKDISVIAESGNLNYSENGITIISYEKSTALPENFVLRQNYPNPFNPTTRIEYQIKEQSEVTLAIYNTAGQLIRMLVKSSQPAGVHSVEWDGRNSSGIQVTSGIYLYRLKAGSFVETRKMVVMK